MHAGWNMLLAGARDSQAATAVAMAIGCVAFAPVAVVTWDVDAEALPFVAASAALELAYFALLALAYSRAELSAVYPLARGSAPVIVLLVSVLFLGATLSGGEVAGVLLVAGGVLLVRELGAGGSRDALLALAVGAAIAGYTLVDKEGLKHADPLPYLELVLVVPALMYLWAVARRGRGRARLSAELSVSTFLAGIGMFAAYALTLAALRLADAAPVAAVRETSIVIGVALGALVLREAVGRARLAGSVVIVAGVAALALA